MTTDNQTLLCNANVFDGTGTPASADVDVLIEGTRIMSVGRDLTARAGAAVIDLGGRWIMPGLIDCHVHFVFPGNPDDVEKARTMQPPQFAWIAAANARRTLEAGVTTARDLGAAHNVNILLRDQIAAGALPGPRMRAVGSIVCITGGHGWFMGREADGPDDVRKAVREQLRAGADAIKFTATGGVMTPGVDPRSPSFTEAELRAGIEEAHNAFRRAAAHAQGTAGIKNAVRAGIDSIEHGIYLDDEVIAEMRERGTYLVPTLSAPANISRYGLAGGIPAYAVEKSDRVQAAHVASFRAALKAGVRIAMGTDAGTPFNRHGENAHEVTLMVRHGMPAADALVAATSAAAELLDLADVTGSIEAGKAADLLVLDGDPLTDIDVLTRSDGIIGVIKDGAWVRRATTIGG